MKINLQAEKIKFGKFGRKSLAKVSIVLIIMSVLIIFLTKVVVPILAEQTEGAPFVQPVSIGGYVDIILNQTSTMLPNETTTTTTSITTSTTTIPVLEDTITTTTTTTTTTEPTGLNSNQLKWKKRMEEGGVKAFVDDSGGKYIATIDKNGIKVGFEDFEDADWSKTVKIIDDVDRNKINEFLSKSGSRSRLKDFVWVETNGFLREGEYKGRIVLPSTYKTVFACEGSKETPSCSMIQACGERPCFEIEDGKTIILLNHFSGGGGADPSVIYYEGSTVLINGTVFAGATSDLDSVGGYYEVEANKTTALGSPANSTRWYDNYEGWTGDVTASPTCPNGGAWASASGWRYCNENADAVMTRESTSIYNFGESSTYSFESYDDDAGGAYINTSFNISNCSKAYFWTRASWAGFDASDLYNIKIKNSTGTFTMFTLTSSNDGSDTSPDAQNDWGGASSAYDPLQFQIYGMEQTVWLIIGGATASEYVWLDNTKVLCEATPEITITALNITHNSSAITQDISAINKLNVSLKFKSNVTETYYFDIWNWTDSKWYQMGTGSVGTTDVTWSWLNDSSASNLIESNDKVVQVRLRASGSEPFRSQEDYLEFNISYITNAPPIWQDNATSFASGSQYTPSRNYGFQINWTDPDSADSLSNATFETNMTTGTTTLENITKASTTKYTTFTNNTAGVWWINFTQEQLKGAGQYVFRWYSNDTSNAWNISDQWNYTIARGSPAARLALNGTEGNKAYTQGAVANITSWVVDNTVNMTIYSNYSGGPALQNITPTQHEPIYNYTDTTNLAAGNYIVLANVTGNANWTNNATGINYTMTITGVYTAVLSQPMQVSSRSPSQLAGIRIKTQAISTSSTSPALQGLLRLLSQALDTEGLYQRIQTGLRTLSQALNISNIVANIKTALAVLSQSLNVSNIISRIASAIKPLSQALSTIAQITRIAQPLRSLSQAFSVQSIVQIARTYVEEMSQSLNLANAVARLSSAIRLLSQSLSLTNIVTRLVGAIKVSSQNLSMSAMAARVATALRVLSQNLAENVAVVRVGTILRTLSQATNLASALEKLRSVSTALSQSLNLNNVVTSLSSVSRIINQNLNMNGVIEKIRWVGRALSQNLAANALTTGISNLLRTLSQNLNLTNVTIKLSSILRYLSQAINLSSAIERLRSVGISLSQNLGLNTVITRLGSALRAINQSLTTSNIVARLREVGRMLSQNLAMNALTTRVSSLLRYLSQSLEENALTARIGSALRSLSGQLSMIADIQRLASISRALSNLLNVNLVVARIQTALRSLSQAINYNSLTTKAYLFIKTLSQSLGTIDLAGRIASAVRVLSQIISENDIASRLASMLRVLTQSIPTLAEITATTKSIYESFSSAALTFTGNIVKSASATRALVQSLVTSAPIQSLRGWIKAMSQSLSANVIVTSIGSLLRALSQSLSNTAMVVRFPTFSEQLSQGLNLSGAATRLSSILRSLSQATNLTSAVERLRFVSKALSQSLSLNNVITSMGSAFRIISQSLSANDIITRLRNVGRTLSQSIDMNVLITRLESILRSISGQVSITGMSSRLPVFVRNISANLAANDVVIWISSTLRTLSQTISNVANAVRTSSVFKALSQSLSLTNVTAAMSSLLRSISQVANLSSAAGELREVLRTLGQNLSLTNLVNRIALASKSLSQSLNMNDVVERVRWIGRALSQNLGLSAAMTRLASVFRVIAQSLASNIVVTRLGSIFRALSQAMSATQQIITNTAFIYERLVSVAMSLSQMVSRLSAASRIFAQNLNMGYFANMLSSFPRTISQSLSLASAVDRLREVGRALSQSLSVNTVLIRLSSISKIISQNLASSDVVARLKETSRSLTQSLNLSGPVNSIASILRTIAQNLVSNSVVEKLRAAGRSISQALSTSAITSRVASVLKAVSQSLLTNNIAVSIASMFRTLSQSFAITGRATGFPMLSYEKIANAALALTDNIAKSISALRTLGQSLNAADTLSRLYSVIRSLSQSVAANGITSSIYNTIRALVQSLTTSAASRAMLAFSRSLSGALTTNAIVTSLASAIRSLTGQIALTDITQNLPGFLRVISQSLSPAALSERAFGILRTLSQSLNLSNISIRVANFARALSGSLNLSSITSKIASVFRVLTQSMSAANQITASAMSVFERFANVPIAARDSVGRLVSTVRALTQSITQNMLLARIGNLFRSVSGQITLAENVGRFTGFIKSIAQSLTGLTASIRDFTFARTLSGSFSIGNVMTGFASVTRSLSQGFDAAGVVARISYLSRTFVQSLAAAGNAVTSTFQIYERIASAYFTINQFVQKSYATSRAVIQSLNLGVITARAASFSRSVFASLSFILSLIFRFPAWFYSSQTSCESAGNYWCSGVCTAYQCGVAAHNKTYENVYADQILELNKTNVNTSISLVTNETIGTIAFDTWLYEETPVSTSLVEDTAMKDLKYFNISTNSSLNETVLTWIMLKFYYSEGELSSSGIVESTLTLYRYNNALNIWTELMNSTAGVFGTGLSADANYVWVNTTHMSVFAIGGLLASGQSCSASAECYSNACCSGTCQSSCAVSPPSAGPSSGPSGGYAGAYVQPIVPPAEINIKYANIAVLRETTPERTALFGVTVKNIGNSSYSNLSVGITGVPKSWVYVSPNILSLRPSESKGLNVLVTPPVDAEPGDYKVNVGLKNAEMESENFFILRVRLTPAEHDRPIVLRQVSIDKESSRTNVDIIVSNPYKEFGQIDIIENIPKDLATSTDSVDFRTSPTEIVRKDPIVLWSIADMLAGEDKTISYSVPKILDEFTQYVYWPLRQMNVLAPSLKNFKIVSFEMPLFHPGETSTVHFVIKNLDVAPHNFTFSMEAASDWEVEPKMIKETILAEEEREFDISVAVPENAQVGNYMAKAVFGWDDGIVVKEYVALVQTPSINMIVIFLIGAACLTALGYEYYCMKVAKQRGFAKTEKLNAIKKALLIRIEKGKTQEIAEELSEVEKLKGELKKGLDKDLEKRFENLKKLKRRVD